MPTSRLMCSAPSWRISIIPILQGGKIGQKVEEWVLKSTPVCLCLWALLAYPACCPGWSFSADSKSVAELGIEARPLFQVTDPQEYF